MAALPYMPLFVADYLADTAHLTTAQHGAYLLLIMNYWQRGGPLPDDDSKLAKIARVGKREWARMREPLSEFFSIADGAWLHSRITAELARVASKSLKSKIAAQASVQRRFGDRSADVEPTDTQAHTEKSSDPNGSAPIDPEKAMFDAGIRLLAGAGMAETKARPLLGKWKRDHGAGAVIEALAAAQRTAAIEPVSFIEARWRSAAARQPAIPI